MNDGELVNIVEKSVRDAAVEFTCKNLEQPPGQSPEPELVAMSQWYLSLSETDRAMVLQVARLAASHATFGFLCVIDGVCPVADGTFELVYVESGQRQKLNTDMLHELFKP